MDSMNVQMSIDGENGITCTAISNVSVRDSASYLALFLLYFSTYTNFKNKIREQGEYHGKEE